jgi:hypothetical protein|tara:strand:- start:1222 stop:1428 length:207 start_codon:yes stop_codon:yes gene_type:complete
MVIDKVCKGVVTLDIMRYIVKAVSISGGEELVWRYGSNLEANQKIRELKDQRGVANEFLIKKQELETA